MKKPKILMVCGAGLGSSFACQMTVETVLAQIGAEANLDHCDISSAVSMRPDIILQLLILRLNLKNLILIQMKQNLFI